MLPLSATRPRGRHPVTMPSDASTPIFVHAFPLWKHRFVRRCFPGRRVVFLRDGAPLPREGTLVLWGMAPLPAGLEPRVEVVRMEDGFLRSVGLGAELARPLSWVVDAHGMYYDATRPSGLELLLADTRFTPELLARARALRERVVREGLSKYNVGSQGWRRPPGARHVVLVAGQVESDASLAHGAPGLRSNLELLRTVRRERPDSHLVYKPHPDVLAGLRLRGAGEAQALQACDEVVGDVPMPAMLAQVDEVQVLTSLAGFEALLRGLPVVCHGQPFYSGWGLTDDRAPLPRRQRRLGLDELVAAALLMYPTYLGPRGPVTPEQALDELAAWKARSAGPRPWWWEGWRFLLRRFIGVR
jgi:capsular polysaccharide export protein